MEQIHAYEVGSTEQITNFLDICVLLFSDEVDSNLPVIVALLFQVDLKDAQRRYILEQLKPYSQARELYGQLAQFNNISELNEESFFNTLQVLLDIGEPSLILVALNSILNWFTQGTGFPAFWGEPFSAPHKDILEQLYSYLLQDSVLYARWVSETRKQRYAAVNMGLVFQDNAEG